MLTRTRTTLLDGLKAPDNPSAWQEFIARYQPLVLAVGRRLGLQEADAEDAAQETLAAFVQAYRKDRYDRQKGRLRDWLCGIACHKVRDVMRRRSRQVRPVTDKTDGTRFLNQIEDTRAESLWDEEWDRAVLRQCLSEVRWQVQPQTYEAFELFVLRQWPPARVAEHLRVSEDVVYQSKSRVLKRVRQLLPRMHEVW